MAYELRMTPARRLYRTSHPSPQRPQHYRYSEPVEPYCRPKATTPKPGKKARTPKPKVNKVPVQHLHDDEEKSGHMIPLYRERMIEDGNCLFRCIAWKEYDDQNEHLQVRHDIEGFVKRIDKNKIFYNHTVQDWISTYSDESHSTIDDYLQWIVKPGGYGDLREVIFASEIYRRTIVVVSNYEVRFVVGEQYQSGDPLFVDLIGEHFNVCIDMESRN